MRKIIVLVLITLSFSAFTESKEQLVNTVLEITGISQEFDQIPTLISNMYIQNQQNIDPKIFKKVVAIIQNQFSATSFVKFIEKYIVQNYDETTILRIISYYNNDTFKKITQRETDFLKNNGILGFDKKEPSDISEGIRKIVMGYMQYSKTIDNQENIVVGAFKAYCETFNLLLSEEKKIKEQQIETILLGIKKQIRSKEIFDQTLNTMLMVYSIFSEIELDTYFSFYYTDEGKWLQAQVHTGIAEAYKACLINAAQEILGVVKTI